jgi:hypothetical protein
MSFKLPPLPALLRFILTVNPNNEFGTILLSGRTTKVIRPESPASKIDLLIMSI